MANLLEQQDLLKGLPDDRLTTLMQNPTGEIPPFLVAAEAQRRQSIRQQFSGGEQESVVDSLISQMSNLPQNVQGADQGQQQMQQMPQMQQDQMQQMPQDQGEQAGIEALQPGMRAGGMVQRYQTGSLVVPTVEDYSSSYYQDPFGIPDMSGGDTSILRSMIPDLGLPPLFPEYKTPEQIAKEKMEARIFPALPPGASAGMSFTKPSIPPDPSAGKKDTSPKNQESPTPEDELRNQLKAALEGSQPSNWEKAQKWFAASQQLVQPGQTTMQALVGAASAFGDAAAEQAKAEREAKLMAAKGLLEYDIGERDAARSSAAKLAEEERVWNRKQQELRTVNADTVIKNNLALVEKLSKDLTENGTSMTPDQVDIYKKKINELMGQNAILMRQSGYDPIASVTENEMNSVLGGR